METEVILSYGFGNAWNELTYFDGILFTIWLGILYIGKKQIDRWMG